MGGVILPDAAWRSRDGLAELVAVLGDCRFVGGSVRDTLLGIPHADVDLATPMEPEDVVRRLKSAGIKAVPTGIEHGTVTAVIASGPVEVTTLRRDVSTDGRHATVAFTDDWREDAARRDFTINALYADPRTGEVFDYFGGLADLETQRVRFIGDPLQRIAEDHLRILRFFRFLARFGDEPDAAGLEACTARAKDLMALSRERIRDELLKLLVAQHAVRVVRLMLEFGIFAAMLPEVNVESADRLEALAAAEMRVGVAADPFRRLAAILPRDPKLGDVIGARLKLSKAERRRLVSAQEPVGGSQFEMAYRLGHEGALDRLLLNGDEAGARALEGWEIPVFPFSGGRIVERGVRSGPEVSRLLHVVEDHWIAEGFPGDARVEQIADEVVLKG